MNEHEVTPGNFGPGTLVEKRALMGDSLIEAVIAGDLVKVSELLKQEVDVNFSNRLGVTALMVAAEWNRPKIVNLLLARGAEVEAQENSSGCNALMFACLSGNPSIVRLLLAHGASVNSVNMDGRTALMTASFCCHVAVVKMLLKHGAEIEAADRFGATALTQADIAGCEGVVDLLVARGTNRTRRTPHTGKAKNVVGGRYGKHTSGI